ncbi:MAG: hypothetical protein MI685_06180 [Chlorobiales bacterium]|nr:hypothetical protein [Chlorobiales bacterium]
MATRSKGKSVEAINLAEEINKWKKEAKNNSYSPWLPHIEKAFRCSADGNYEEALVHYKKATKINSDEKKYLENYEIYLIELTNARKQLNANKHKFISDYLNELTNDISGIYKNIYLGLTDIHNRSINQSFENIRIKRVKEILKIEQEAQARLEVLLRPVKNIVNKQRIPKKILNTIFPGCRFNNYFYLEVTQATLLKLKDDPELSDSLKIDLSQIGGFVTHHQAHIDMMEKLLNEEYGGGYLKLHSPLIVFKKGFSESTLFHELTHACIKQIDCFLHMYRMFNNFSYEQDPEERLAFANQILLYKYKYPRDTFDEYIRIQAKMNISGESIVESGGPHVKLQKSIWETIDYILTKKQFYYYPYWVPFFTRDKIVQFPQTLLVKKKLKNKKIKKSNIARLQSVLIGNLLLFIVYSRFRDKWDHRNIYKWDKAKWSVICSWYKPYGRYFKKTNSLYIKAYDALFAEQISNPIYAYICALKGLEKFKSKFEGAYNTYSYYKIKRKKDLHLAIDSKSGSRLGSGRKKSERERAYKANYLMHKELRNSMIETYKIDVDKALKEKEEYEDKKRRYRNPIIFIISIYYDIKFEIKWFFKNLNK